MKAPYPHPPQDLQRKWELGRFRSDSPLISVTPDLTLLPCLSLFSSITISESPSILPWKISQEDFVENYDPSVLPSVTYLLYEIKWNHRRRTWQRWICSAGGEHAETYFLKDVYRKLRSNPFVHCSITCYISWSPCGYCCQEIMDFLEKMPNLNLVIYVARLYWHKEETNREGLWNLENIGVSIQVMDLPDYSYCWTTFVDDEDKYEDEDDYWPRHFSPWIMLYSLELQSILQNIPSCLEISSDENYTPVFSLCVEDEEQKRALTSASPY
ncbi:C-_U-editing enzyme APOBEC-1-like isoform X2 [Mauremys mutica]|uniref:C->U-editing enzyme APOBEC-1-like isoform X2 n=1 Tax=Mauremys mutica TaxID=74926 RepID=UPI001D145426|nr:C->U-editing enzyme APOBEC-1-like isoform X2 [Mauremys mutica]